MSMTAKKNQSTTTDKNDEFCQAVRSSLLKLGDEPDKIAKALSRRRIVGCTGDLTECPLAVYLHKEFPEKEFEVAGEYIAVIGDEPCTLWCNPQSAVDHEVPEDHQLPRAFEDFVAKFDEGEYPGLKKYPD